MSDPTPEAPPTVTVTGPAVISVPVVDVPKPWYKQVSNYAGAAALGGAGFIVAHPEILALIPGVPGWAASLGLSVIGAGLVAYKESHKSTTTTIGVTSK